MLGSPRRAERLVTVLASALLLIGTATACGSGDDSDAGPDDAAAANGAFPVSIAHKYGSTTIKAEPQRIVTVGLTDQDAVLALGKVPVGTTEWLGGYKGAIGPWATGELDGAKTPTVPVSFVSVLSLPYMLERLVPQLASAVDGDTATKVKQHAGSQ